MSYLAKLSIVANLITVVTAPVVSESPLLTILGTYLLTASKKKSRSMSKLRASRRISTCSSTFSNKSDLWAEIKFAVNNSPKHSLLKIIFGAKIQTFLHTFELYSDDIWTGDRTKNYTWFYTNAPAFWQIFFSALGCCHLTVRWRVRTLYSGCIRTEIFFAPSQGEASKNGSQPDQPVFSYWIFAPKIVKLVLIFLIFKHLKFYANFCATNSIF